MVKTIAEDEINTLQLESDAVIVIGINPHERDGAVSKLMVLGKTNAMEIIEASARCTASLIKVAGKNDYMKCRMLRKMFFQSVKDGMEKDTSVTERSEITPVREDVVHWQ